MNTHASWFPLFFIIVAGNMANGGNAFMMSQGFYDQPGYASHAMHNSPVNNGRDTMSINSSASRNSQINHDDPPFSRYLNDLNLVIAQTEALIASSSVLAQISNFS